MSEPQRYIKQNYDFDTAVHMLCVHRHVNVLESVKHSTVIIDNALYVDLAKGYFDEYAIEFFYGQNIITFEERELANRARQRRLLPKLPTSWDL